MRAGAFLRRDWCIAISHRVPFLIEGIAIGFALLEVWFISRIVEAGAVPGGYFSFVVSGLVLTALLAAGIVTMASFVRQEQVQGTLEVLVSTGIEPGRLVTLVAAYPFAAAVVRAGVFLVIAAVLGAGVGGDANWSLALAGLALASISFVALGVLASSLVLTFRQAAGATSWLLTMLVFAAGVGFPPALLPDWLQWASTLSPLTLGLRVVRAAVLEGASWASQLETLLGLMLVAAILGAVGWASTRLAIRRALRRGTLAQY